MSITYDTLVLHILTPTVHETLLQIQQHGLLPGMPPKIFQSTFSGFTEGDNVPKNWQELLTTENTVTSIWVEETSESISQRQLYMRRDEGHIELTFLSGQWDVTSFEQVWSQIPFEVMTIEGLSSQQRRTSSQQTPQPGAISFTGYDQTAWGLILKKEGHQRVVSKQWLEQGPWYLRQGSDDTTFVYLANPEADVDAFMSQLSHSHDAMNSAKSGGYLQRPHRMADRMGASSRGKLIYEPSEGELVLIVGGGRPPVPVATMVDLRAALVPPYQPHELARQEYLEPPIYHHRSFLGVSNELHRVSMTFALDERAAYQHLHDLWLYGVECWLIRPSDGAKIRLDEDYSPPPAPSKPAWVQDFARRMEAEQE